MKITYLFHCIVLLGCLQACTPDSAEYFDMNEYEIAKVELGADHRQVIADGRAMLTLNPMLYRSYTYRTAEGKDSTVYGKIQTDRIVPGTVKYFLEDGTPLDGPYYKTTDISVTERGFYAVVGDMKSNIFKVTIRKPFAEDEHDVIEYPVVFHIIQDKQQVDLGQGMGSDIIHYAFETINNCFGRSAVFSPNSADTKIRFRLAEYDSKGKKMVEKGINRYPLPLDAIKELKILSNIKANPDICWNYKKYLNIWLIAEASTATATTPQWILESADLNNLKGISIQKKTEAEIEGMNYAVTDIGLIINAKKFATEDCGGYTTCMARFFGLLDNKANKDDYCDDTFTYTNYVEPWNKVGQGSNGTLKLSKDDLIFYAVNVMDDGSARNTISMDQVKRIRTIADHCPHRWAWKSKWAFTGKE